MGSWYYVCIYNHTAPRWLPLSQARYPILHLILCQSRLFVAQTESLFYIVNCDIR